MIGDAALEALLEEARARIGFPPRDASCAVRLDAGLALLRATRADQRARVHVADAADLTDEAIPASDRTAALFAQAVSWEGPDDVAARSANGDALLEHGLRSGDSVAVALGHLYRGWALLEHGEFQAASAERAAALRAGASCSHPHLAAQMADTAFLGALLDGDLDLAATLSDEVALAWRQSADPSFAWTVDVCCRMFLGELTTGLEPLLPDFIAASHAMPSEAMWKVAIALAHGLARRDDAARATLDSLSPSQLRALPRSTIWTGNVSGLAATAALCRHAATAATVRDLLQPIADLQIVCGGLVYRGSVAYWLGRCEQTLGRSDDAIALLRMGFIDHQRAPSPPWIALGAVALAEALLDRNAGGDREEARALAHQARTIVEGSGMNLVVRSCVELTSRHGQTATGSNI